MKLTRRKKKKTRFEFSRASPVSKEEQKNRLWRRRRPRLVDQKRRALARFREFLPICSTLDANEKREKFVRIRLDEGMLLIFTAKKKGGGLSVSKIYYTHHKTGRIKKEGKKTSFDLEERKEGKIGK